MPLFEIPTGVLADTRGRRTLFLLSVAVVLVGTLGYVGTAAAGGNLLLFSLMSVILGLLIQPINSGGEYKCRTQ